MFDIHRIGQYISFLRKNNNMTQGQLAEKLGVSHQAVSNWERGEAMPDIALLTRLASALNTTSDRILLSGEDIITEQDSKHSLNFTMKHNEINESPVFEIVSINSDENVDISNKQSLVSDLISDHKNVMKGKEKRLYELNNTIKILDDKMKGSHSQTVIDKIQNLMDQVQEQADEIQEEIDEILEEIDEILEEIDEDQSALDELENVAYLEALEGIENLAGLEGLSHHKNILDTDDFNKEEPNADINDADAEKINWQHILAVAPFASSETLDNLVAKIDEKVDYKKVMQIVPFLSSSTIERLILDAFRAGINPDWDIVMNLAPFASSGTLDILLEKLDEKVDFSKIKRLAPFLKSSLIEKLVLDAFKAGVNPDWNIIKGLAPFASSNTLDLLIANMDHKIDFNLLMELAPFLNSKTIDKLINQSI